MNAQKHNEPTTIAVIAEFDPDFPPHPATNAAIEHSSKQLGMAARGDWISTEGLRVQALSKYDALWIGPGSPYKNMQNTLDAIQYARENGVPCFGTCAGFQHIVIEYARNVLGYKDAHHAEYDPYSSNLFISALACSPAGHKMKVTLIPGSKVAACYGGLQAMESYYCNFGINPRVLPLLNGGALRTAGLDNNGEIRVLELPDHPFFVATLYVPQNDSRPQLPHPLVTSFIRAAQEAHQGKGAQPMVG